MDVKAAAMRAWSEALIESFLKAGGRLPQPTEGPRSSKLKQKNLDAALPARIPRL
jgi:hypothetical protein